VAKNLTIALDEGLIAQAREYARLRDQSLNDLIRALLRGAVEPEPSAGPVATFHLMDLSHPAPSRGRWTRDELHQRGRR
jgi:hypothetical protein